MNTLGKTVNMTLCLCWSKLTSLCSVLSIQIFTFDNAERGAWQKVELGPVSTVKFGEVALGCTMPTRYNSFCSQIMVQERGLNPYLEYQKCSMVTTQCPILPWYFSLNQTCCVRRQ